MKTKTIKRPIDLRARLEAEAAGKSEKPRGNCIEQAALASAAPFAGQCAALVLETARSSSTERIAAPHALLLPLP